LELPGKRADMGKNPMLVLLATLIAMAAASNMKASQLSQAPQKTYATASAATQVMTSAGAAALQSSAPVTQPESKERANGTGPTSHATAPANMTIPAGTRIVVRLDSELSSKTSEEETLFTGSVARRVVVGTRTVIPLGTPAKGLIEEAEPAEKGPKGAELQLRLTSVTLAGRLYPMRTASVSPSSKGKGRAANSVSAGNADITLPAGSTVSFKLLLPLKIAAQP